MKIGRCKPLLISIISVVVLLFMVSFFFQATQKRESSFSFQRSPEMSITGAAETEQSAPIGLCPDKADIKIDLKVGSLERNGQTYEADFTGDYTLKNPFPYPSNVSFLFPFPTTAGTISNVQLLIDNTEFPGVHFSSDGIHCTLGLGPNASREILITYRAKGLNSYIYALDHNRRIEELNLRMVLSGIQDIEFPPTTLPPTTMKKTEEGLNLSWNLKKTITRYDIGVDLSGRPGHARKFAILGYLAPLILVLFLGCLRLSARQDTVYIKTHHYLLLGVCFFLFYPLIFALTGYISTIWAFLLSIVVIGLLILGFLRQITTTEFVLKRGIVFLVVFLFLWTLAVLLAGRMMPLLFVLGGLVLVANFMWQELQTRKKVLLEPAAPKIEIEEIRDDGLSELLTGLRVEPDIEPGSAEARTLETIKGYCPFCGHNIAAEYEFCPSCGKSIPKSITCPGCGREMCAECASQFRFCPECGAGLVRQEKRERESGLKERGQAR